MTKLSESLPLVAAAVSDIGRPLPYNKTIRERGITTPSNRFLCDPLTEKELGDKFSFDDKPYTVQEHAWCSLARNATRTIGLSAYQVRRLMQLEGELP